MAPEARFVVTSTGTFDFTPAFEDTILGIIPSVLFVTVALQRLWLARQPRKVVKGHRPMVKVARNSLCPRKHRWFWVVSARKTTAD